MPWQRTYILLSEHLYAGILSKGCFRFLTSLFQDIFGLTNFPKLLPVKEQQGISMIVVMPSAAA